MARHTADAIGNFFQYGFDPVKRTLYMGSTEYEGEFGESGVNSTMVERIIKGLHLLDYGDFSPITIKMNNPGGDVYSGIAIYDAIAACHSEVTIIVYGQAISMGCFILQAADHRVLMPHATIMWHPGTDEFVGHITDMERAVAENKRLCVMAEQIFLPRIREAIPDYTSERYYSEFAFDCYLSAEDAVKMGLADTILEN